MTIKQKIQNLKKKINDNPEDAITAALVAAAGTIVVSLFAYTAYKVATAEEGTYEFFAIDLKAMENELPQGRTSFYETDTDIYYVDREAKK